MQAALTVPTIHVVPTTMDGTRAALNAAARRGARHPQFINRLVDGFDEISKAIDQPVQIRVCLGPSPAVATVRMTPAHATVYLGGRTSIVWPGAEERLAACLRRADRDVVFVGCDSKGTPESGKRADADA